MNASYRENSGSRRTSADAKPTRSKPSVRALSRMATSSSVMGQPCYPRQRSWAHRRAFFSRVRRGCALGPCGTLRRMSWDEPPFTLRQRDAPAIAFRVFRPKDTPKVSVLMSFGYFENMARYREVIERWNARGILIAIYDLRGHGHSEGRRGFVSRFDEYVDDAASLVRELDENHGFRRHAPHVLFGHSLGGLISIR